MFENGLYYVTMKDATSTGLFLGQQKSTSDKSQELLPPILESLSRSVLTRVTLCGEDCKIYKMIVVMRLPDHLSTNPSSPGRCPG